MFCKAILHNGNSTEEMQVERNKYFLLPRLQEKGKTFLGWSRYEKLNYGYMNMSIPQDSPLFAIFTDGPAYVIESHYRGEEDNYIGPRCQFRRYVVDIYLENAVGTQGAFELEAPSNCFYYLGYVPEDGVKLNVKDVSNFRGHAYNGYAQMTTSSVAINWNSEKTINALEERVKIGRIMFNFSRWWLGYNEIERRTSDEIICCAWDKQAFVDERQALVSANFYNGTVHEDKCEVISEDENVISVTGEKRLPDILKGELLSRFAVLSDSHVGAGYNFENYDWLYNIYAHLKAIHKETPLNFVMELGDNINNGYQNTYKPDYEEYLEVVKKLEICDAVNPIEGIAKGKIPHYEIQGNHDTSMSTRFFRQKLWFAENANGKKTAYIAFFAGYGGYPAVVNTVKGDCGTYRSYGIIEEEMSNFVEKSILEAIENNAKQIVLCCHFGIAPDLLGQILPESGFGKIENLCKKYDIKLYFSGHEHNAQYTLRKCGTLYNYDAAMTMHKYSVVEIYEKQIITRIYNTEDNSLYRTDFIKL